MRISQAAAISVPPPTQLPSMAAIVGVDEFATAASAVELSSQKSSSGTLRSAMSEPAEKCPPAPVITSAPIESSASTEARSEEHTSELQSRFELVCRLLLEKKKY